MLKIKIKYTTYFGQYGHHQVLRFACIQAFKEGHAGKSAEERRHSKYNTRAHLGEIYNSNNQNSSFPSNNKS
jgi:hypothetical protein